MPQSDPHRFSPGAATVSFTLRRTQKSTACLFLTPHPSGRDEEGRLAPEEFWGPGLIPARAEFWDPQRDKTDAQATSPKSSRRLGSQKMFSEGFQRNVWRGQRAHKLFPVLTAHVFLSLKKVCFPVSEKKEKATHLITEDKVCQSVSL